MKDGEKTKEGIGKLLIPDKDGAQGYCKLEKELKNLKDDLLTWTDSLDELSVIERAFKTYEKNSPDGKAILDVGTDCVKPLYIALKFKPAKVIGINEDLYIYSFASDLKQKSKFFTNTKIELCNCSLFDNEKFDRTMKKHGFSNRKFDFVLVSKTLHHLRTGECIAQNRDRKHDCKKDETEKDCIYEFDEQLVFEKLLELGTRVIIYEWFDPTRKDPDKIRGRGGYFTTEEWMKMFKYLSGKHRVKFIQPKRFDLDKEPLDRVESMLRQVDNICFYVEEQHVRNAEKL